MRELTEQEEKAKLDACQKFLSEYGEYVTIHHRRGFSAGFIAGLEYQRARIDELESELKAMQRDPSHPHQNR